MRLQWSSGAQTHTGKVRKLNEDSLVSLPQMGVWAVADGMGGHSKGDLASQTVAQHISEQSFHAQSETAVEQFLDAVALAHQKLRQIAESEQEMVGTTVIGMVAKTDSVVILHAGDSRAYLMRGGRLDQITQDHTLVTDLVRAGQISADEATSHPSGHVLSRAVGQPEPLSLEESEIEIQNGDRILLCSDGLYNEINDDALKDILGEGRATNAVLRLIQTSLLGRCADNVTALVVDFTYV